VKEILDTVLDPGSRPADFAALPLPDSYRAVTLHRDDEHMFDGVEVGQRDPRESLHAGSACPSGTWATCGPCSMASRWTR
jgi:hypothetical protein